MVMIIPDQVEQPKARIERPKRPTLRGRAKTEARAKKKAERQRRKRSRR